MENRKYLPTLNELIDRLSIHLLKEVFIPENKENYAKEIKDMMYDIDLILITEPRRTSESSAYTNLDVLNYLKYVNSETLVVHRINECDERKGTNFVNSDTSSRNYRSARLTH